MTPVNTVYSRNHSNGTRVSDGNCPLKLLHGCPSLVLPDPPVLFQFNVLMLQCCTAMLHTREIRPLVVFLNLLMHYFISVCVCVCVCVCVYIHKNTSVSTAQKTLHLRVLCGNKMPTRCNRGFYCRSYCLLNMFRAPLCPSSGAQEYYTVVAACGISCCGFQVAGLVWS